MNVYHNNLLALGSRHMFCKTAWHPPPSQANNNSLISYSMFYLCQIVHRYVHCFGSLPKHAAFGFPWLPENCTHTHTHGRLHVHVVDNASMITLNTSLFQHMLTIYSHMYLQIDVTFSIIEKTIFDEKVLRFLPQRILLCFYHVRRNLPSTQVVHECLVLFHVHLGWYSTTQVQRTQLSTSATCWRAAIFLFAFQIS